MKKIFMYMFAFVAAVTALVSCDDWTDTEIKNPADLTHTNKSEAYYQQLRDYKKSNHEVAFGWFGNWVGAGASQENSLAGLPDSVDFVSIWGNWHSLSAERKADLKYVQEVKGTRALLCFIVANIGDQLTPEGEDRTTFWGTGEEAIRKYASAICDTIEKYNYDGFDWDYEPHYGSSGDIAGNAEAEKIFVDELSKRVGKRSNSGRMLVIDGEPQSVAAETGDAFNYFIVQAYSSYGYNDLDNRLAQTIRHYDGVLSAEEVANKYIVTENFENYAKQGGVDFTTRDGRTVKSLQGMAEWEPVVDGKHLRKGGCGTYHMEYEYSVSGYSTSYPFLRKAIQIQNPTVK